MDWPVSFSLRFVGESFRILAVFRDSFVGSRYVYSRARHIEKEYLRGGGVVQPAVVQPTEQGGGVPPSANEGDDEGRKSIHNTCPAGHTYPPQFVEGAGCVGLPAN